MYASEDIRYPTGRFTMLQYSAWHDSHHTVKNAKIP